MDLQQVAMKLIVKIKDVVELAKRFETAPAEALREVVEQARQAVAITLEQVLETEIAIFLGQDSELHNKRNGFVTRTFAIKGLGALRLRVPRDRDSKFVSHAVAANRHYDAALEKDLALLHLAGLSTRTLSMVSGRILGHKVSAQEVSNALHTLVPAAKKFLERSLSGRRYMYLYIDGTNFHIRRTTVEREPVLVVIGVTESSHKSILATVSGDKESRDSWGMVFNSLKERGLDCSSVQLGVMDGLPGLGSAFLEAFPKARVARCWVHKARNVFPRVAKRYQAEFKTDWDKVAYATNKSAAEQTLKEMQLRWGKICSDAMENFVTDKEALLTHYDFPEEHWDALRTTNPIERVNKEFKRRSKSMETLSPEGQKVLLAFTAVRLEHGWSMVSITSPAMGNLRNRRAQIQMGALEAATQTLLN